MRENIRAWAKLLFLLMDEAIIIFGLVFLLWKLGVNVDTWILVVAGGVVAVIVLFLHIILLPFLKDTGAAGPANMVGLEGDVVTRLSPKGVVKVRGELWKAVVTNAEVDVGQRVIIVGLEGLKLLVKEK